MTLFEEYLFVLKAESDEWYNEVEWWPGISALTKYRRDKIQSALRTGKIHRPFPQRADAPEMNWQQ